MDIGQYRKWAQKAQRNPRIPQRIHALNTALVIVGYVAYPLLLAICLIRALNGEAGWQDLIKAILVPGISFALVSIVRAKINAPRPYEVYDIAPLISKDTRGKSMPSRHAFSIFMIAFSWVLAGPTIGPIAVVVLTIVGGMLAYIRVISGVHFPRDVITAALVALACACIGYGLL